MSFLTAVQALEANGISISNNYATWLNEINKAFQDNYSTSLSISDVYDAVHNTWPSIQRNDMEILLESIYKPDGTRAFASIDVRDFLSRTHESPKIQFSVFAIMADGTPSAGPRWQNTEFLVEPGLTVSAKYISGQWTANPATGMVGAEGNPNYIAKPGYTLPGANEGALVGRVVNAEGPGPVFLIGNTATIPTTTRGYLELGINDDLLGAYGEGLPDNVGSLVVEIESSGVAIPISNEEST